MFDQIPVWRLMSFAAMVGYDLPLVEVGVHLLVRIAISRVSRNSIKRYECLALSARW